MSGTQSQKLRLATGAADQRSGSGTVSDPAGECPLVDLHPPVFFDAHMHIQSGACAPLAPLHARMAGIDLSRSTIDAAGTWWIMQKLATGKIGDISPKPTDEIGRFVVDEYKKLSYLGTPAQSSFLGICIVLTMDMDFCHIDGYEGLSVYFHDTDPGSKHKGERYYLKRKTGTQPREECKRVYLNWREDWPLDVEEKNREIRTVEADRSMPEDQRRARIEALQTERSRTIRDLSSREFESANPYRPPHDEFGVGAAAYAEQYEARREAFCKAKATQIEADMARTDFARSDDLTLDNFLVDMNTSLFETWNQQLIRTERVSVQNPLRLMPMYHYDPRRYIKEDGSAPFNQLYEQGGVYIGFKMYTSQGYMPSESTTAGAAVKGITTSFFARCASLDVPIMVHCTPAGFYTHQRELYIDLASEAERALYMPRGRTKLRDVDRTRYFQEHFVHPEAWRPVLRDNPSLRLCLAHFASDKPLWNDDPAEYSKPALTREEMPILFQKMEEHNDMRSMSEQGRLGERDLIDALWRTNAFPGKSKPSIDGSDVVYARSWIRTIVEMCMEFPNFYTDVSYLPLFEKMDSWGLFKKRRHYWHMLADIIRLYPRMVDKIMFGTDWYMILLEPHKYEAWFKQMREALDETQKELGGQYTTWHLFHQFAIINPIKFYRVHERHPKIKAALEAKIGKVRGIDSGAAQRELTRLYETLKRVDAGKLAQMEQDVKKGPLKFTLTEVDQ